jgi:CBS domain-containing protein
MHHQLKDLMSRDVKVVGPDMTINEAAQTMRDGDFGMLPVVNRDKRLVGIISLGDFAVDRSEIQPAAEALAKISEPS